MYAPNGQDIVRIKDCPFLDKTHEKIVGAVSGALSYLSGSHEHEPATVEIIDAYLEQNGYVNDMSDERLHHEIYLSDARKVTPEKQKTVIRHPIKKL